MSTASTEVQRDESHIVSVYFPKDKTHVITTANETLLPKGYSKNFILLEALLIGLPRVVKKYADKAAPSSFTDQVLRAVLSFGPKDDITTQIVAEKLEQTDPTLKESNPSGFDNISKVLERLGERQILTSDGMAGRKKVWHLALDKKKIAQMLSELNAAAA